MQTLLNRMVSFLRGWLGWREPSAADPDGVLMTPAHGWLLRPAGQARRTAGDRTKAVDPQSKA